MYKCNNQRIIRCFLCLPLTALVFSLFGGENHGILKLSFGYCSIGVAITSITIILMLAIINPVYFAIASLAVMKYIK